jgi:glucan phosphoethanolaminetransferase (alkaline phosphatase superfamily)
VLKPRSAQAPHHLAACGSAWLAAAGHAPLWQALARLPELADGRAPVFIGSTLVLLAALFTLGFCALAWPRLIRPALSVALLGTAWAAQAAGGVADMPPPTLFLLTAGAPLLWLWGHPVATAQDTWTQLLNNLGTALVAAGVATSVLILSVADFSWMWLQHAALAEMLSPVSVWRLLAATLSGP